MSTTVVIVDDHEVVRIGLSHVLDSALGFEVVAVAGSAAEGLEAVERCRPDVLVLDVRLPDRPGIAIVDDVRRLSPATRILVLTSYGEDRAVVEAVAAGVDGFLVKTTDSAALIDAVRALADGRPLLREQVADALVRYVQGGAPGAREESEPLTQREREIAAAAAGGRSNREIAAMLGLSEKTVRNHVSEILSKLGLDRRSQIALALFSWPDPARSPTAPARPDGERAPGAADR